VTIVGLWDMGTPQVMLPQLAVLAISSPLVPDLTSHNRINLNERLRLRRRAKALSVTVSDIALRPGISVARPPGDHIPLGGFVSQLG